MLFATATYSAKLHDILLCMRSEPSIGYDGLVTGHTMKLVQDRMRGAGHFSLSRDLTSMRFYIMPFKYIFWHSAPCLTWSLAWSELE